MLNIKLTSETAIRNELQEAIRPMIEDIRKKEFHDWILIAPCKDGSIGLPLPVCNNFHDSLLLKTQLLDELEEKSNADMVHNVVCEIMKDIVNGTIDIENPDTYVDKIWLVIAYLARISNDQHTLELFEDQKVLLVMFSIQ